MLDEIKVLIKEEEIQNRIKEIANDISNDYENEEIILVCILKGATYFAIDLSRKITNNMVL